MSWIKLILRSLRKDQKGKMIEMTFFDFHEHNYKNNRFCLYVMKNGHGGILYIGISTNNVWERWFGWGGHVTWDGNVIKDTTPKSKKEIEWESYVDNAYNEIFNKNNNE